MARYRMARLTDSKSSSFLTDSKVAGIYALMPSVPVIHFTTPLIYDHER
jgi:hypothetical protein